MIEQYVPDDSTVSRDSVLLKSRLLHTSELCRHSLFISRARSACDQFTMGKPFVAYRECSEPQSQPSSPDVSNQNGRLDSAGATHSRSAPPQDALQAAESYFKQISETSSRKSEVSSHGPPKTLFQMLQEETHEPVEFGPTQHRKSIREVFQMNNSKSSAEVRSTRISPGQGYIDSAEAASPTEFSLDDSATSPRYKSMFSPPASELDHTKSPAQANIYDLQTPGEFSLDDSDSGQTDDSMCSPQTVSSSGRMLQENEMIAQGLNFANVEGVGSPDPQRGGESAPQGSGNLLQSVQLEDSQIEEARQHLQDRPSKDSEFEWRGVLRRSDRSLDSMSQDSFKTSRSVGTSSTNSRYSLSEEAISERTAAWGNGVARLVLKNSSRESTPRTSTASSVDGLQQQYGQKIPGVAKHVKDAFSSFQLAFVVCDVINPDKPVQFASAGFLDMTGYSLDEVVGRNCRFLQGVDTDAKEVARMSTALKAGEAYSGTILNYKKNGTPFWNLVTLSPISDDKGVVIKYMGMQAEVKSSSISRARRKKATVDTTCKALPQSITEEIAQPSQRSEREEDEAIFTLPSTSGVTATQDSNGRSQGSRRYSLTYGPNGPNHVRSRSVSEVRPRRSIGGSEMYSIPSARKRSLAPQQRPAKPSSAGPFYWLLTAARILEEEIQQLGPSNQNLVDDHTKRKIFRRDEREGGVKNMNKISRMANGVLGLFRKLERNVFKRKSRAPSSSNRVNAYHSESDSEIDDFQDIDGNIMNDTYFKRQDLRCESMPHINSTRGGSASNLVMQAELQDSLRARSTRNFGTQSATPDKSFRKSFSSNTSEFVLDRKQFCIIHE